MKIAMVLALFVMVSCAKQEETVTTTTTAEETTKVPEATATQPTTTTQERPRMAKTYQQWKMEQDAKNNKPEPKRPDFNKPK